MSTEQHISPSAIVTKAGVGVDGPGYLGGEAPEGRTTVGGVPVSADVDVFYELDNKDWQCVASTTSQSDGTWSIVGLNPDKKFNVVARHASFGGVIAVDVQPSRTDVVALSGAFTANDDFNGVAGFMTVESGMPPFAASVVDPLPYGLTPLVVDGRKLIIDGTSNDVGLWESVVRVTGSNGVWVDVPVQVQIQAQPDPHLDKVVALLHFDGDLTDEADSLRQWSGNYVASHHPGVNGSLALDKTARISVPDSSNDQPTPWVFYKEEATLEFFLQRDSGANGGNVISLWPSNIRFKCEIVAAKLVFTAFIGSIRTMTFDLPFIDTGFEHIAIVKNSAGVFNAFRRGIKLPEQHGPFTGATFHGTGGNVTCGGVTIDELRITKGVARYTENFTPPDKPFPSR